MDWQSAQRHSATPPDARPQPRQMSSPSGSASGRGHSPHHRRTRPGRRTPSDAVFHSTPTRPLDRPRSRPPCWSCAPAGRSPRASPPGLSSPLPPGPRSPSAQSRGISFSPCPVTETAAERSSANSPHPMNGESPTRPCGLPGLPPVEVPAASRPAESSATAPTVSPNIALAQASDCRACPSSACAPARSRAARAGRSPRQLAPQSGGRPAPRPPPADCRGRHAQVQSRSGHRSPQQPSRFRVRHHP